MSTITKMQSHMSQSRAAIAWYASIVTWLLNRCENTPLALVELIREKSHELHVEFGPAGKKEGK